MNVVEVTRGSSPVILAFPHVGTLVPHDIAERLNDEGKKLRDTDWHVDRLYAGLLPGATTVRATFHRYVIDANRDPSGASLYPGQNTTGLVPLSDFDNRPIWKAGEEPAEADIEERLALFHRPYHEVLSAEVERVKSLHGMAVLYDCHSIRSRCPFLFDGLLPDLNIGSDGGRTCAPEVEQAAAQICQSAAGFSHIVNGRFRGGWTTRHYGKPESGVHAIQMELAQATHLTAEAPPFAYDEAKAERLRVLLKQILLRLEHVAKTLATGGKA